MLITYTDVEKLREQGLKWREIGEYYAIPLNLDVESVRNTLRHVYRRKGKTNLGKCTILSNRMLEGADGSTTSEKTFLTPLKNANEAELLAFHGFNKEDWHIKESVSAVKNEKWTSRIKVLPREYADISEDKIISAIKSALENFNVPEYSIPVSENISTAVLPLYDIHYGRRYIVNGVTYDHTNTAKTLIHNVGQFVDKMNKSDATKLVIIIGQDFFNADNPAGTTTKGTPQDNSLPWHEMFSTGLALMHKIIEMCRGRVHIEIIYSEGNHDVVLGYCLAQALQEAYRNCDDVTFDISAKIRKYLKIGKSLVGIAHFLDDKKASTLMQTEVPVLWGMTKYHFWLTGHVHHLEIYDVNGLVYIKCPSPIFEDEWSEKNGFIGSMKKQSAFLFNDTGMGEMWLLGN